MKNLTGRKRKANYDEVTNYVAANPTMLQSEVAKHFGISQCRVSYILSLTDVRTPRRGRPVKVKPGLTDEQNEWEAILHAHGLGMDRGLRLNNERILYGYDPAMQRRSESSVTN